MIDIVGHIKITDEKRFKYLIACIRSYEFLRDHCRFILSIDGLNHEQRQKVSIALNPFDYTIVIEPKGNYGEVYCKLLDEGTNPFVINFMEDQFMLIEDKVWFIGLLRHMEQHSIEVCKASFHKIEMNSSYTINGEHSSFGLTYDNNERNFSEYKRHYKERYYLGVNFITSRSFAYTFWNRDIKGNRPHPYEVCAYDKYFSHKCIIPAKEIQCAIDDSHGQEGTCLIERKEEKYDRLISYS